MYRFLASLFLMSFLIACWDNPYEIPTLNGNVNIANELKEANISLFEMQPSGQKGALLGTATSDQNGRFEMPLARVHEGPVLLEAKNGKYFDPVYKNFYENNHVFFNAIPEMRYKHNKANINIWTTLAFHRVLGTVTISSDLKEKIKKSTDALSRYLQFPITTAEKCNIFSTNCINNSKNLMFSLSQVGIHQLAKEKGLSFGYLMSFLEHDISDGKLDGYEDRVALIVNNELMDGFMLREHFVRAMHLYLKEAVRESGMMPDSYDRVLYDDEKNKTKGLFSQISTSEESELFFDKPIPRSPVFEKKVYAVKIKINPDIPDLSPPSEEAGKEKRPRFLYDPFLAEDDFSYKFRRLNYLKKIIELKPEEGLKPDFVFAHALIENSELRDIEVKLDITSWHLDLYRTKLRWDPKVNPATGWSVNNDEKFCNVNNVSPGRKLKPVLAANKLDDLIADQRIRVFKFLHNTIGEEIFPLNDFIRIPAEQAVFIKWYGSPIKINLAKTLNQGQFPKDQSCNSKYWPEFLKQCGIDAQKRFFENKCTGVNAEGHGQSFFAWSGLKVMLDEINSEIRISGQPETAVNESLSKAEREQNPRKL